MADDLDVDAMLESCFEKQENSDIKRQRSRSKEKDRRRRSRDRDRDRDRDRRRDHDRDRRDRDRRSHRDDRDRRRDRDRDRDRDDRSHRRSRSRERDLFKGGFRDRFKRRSVSPLRVSAPDLTQEERDARTVLCMQLAARIKSRDLEEFFSAVGKVNDVRLILDSRTRRSKGIAYVEFAEVDAVPLAIGLTGQRLLGVPIIVQASQAEKNRLAAAAQASSQRLAYGPMKVYIGSLHPSITEDMLRKMFEPFGKIDGLNLMCDSEKRSKGFGFITFREAEDARRAQDQLNGFELAGRPMKVTLVTDRMAEEMEQANMDMEEIDRAGVNLGATGRIQLMAKLAEGAGMELPPNAVSVINSTASAMPTDTTLSVPPIATQCFMLSNMFDPTSEISPTYDIEVRNDVIQECNKYGGVVHVYVDKASPQGNIYVKCPNVMAAVQSVNALHGRTFNGKIITAAYVPLVNYDALFADSVSAVMPLQPSNPTQAFQPFISPSVASSMPLGMTSQSFPGYV